MALGFDGCRALSMYVGHGTRVFKLNLASSMLSFRSAIDGRRYSSANAEEHKTQLLVLANFTNHSSCKPVQNCKPTSGQICWILPEGWGKGPRLAGGIKFYTRNYESHTR